MSSATSQDARAAEDYEQFYGFVRPPFTLTPDPRFLYRSESHDEALTLLLRAIRRKEGFIVLTGDIGTGKTTTCRALLEQLDTSTFTSLILNPFLSVEELLREVLLDFGVLSREAIRSGRIANASIHELMSTLHEFLISLITIKGSAAIIIDEAQLLDPLVLEQIRILSNLETNQSKLLQIVLVGQLNLLDALGDVAMRQLDQRIAIRATLKPLTRDEVEAYIAHRVWVARGSTAVVFQPDALDVVHRLTKGVPRIINLVCDRALMAGAAARVATITPGLIEEAAGKLGLRLAEERPIAGPHRSSAWLWIALGALAAIVYLVAGGARAASPPAPPPPPQLLRAEPARAVPIPANALRPPAP